MKILITFKIIVICVIFLQNCSNRQDNYTKWLGKELIVPSDTNKIKVKDINTKHNFLHNNNNLKLIVTINGECGSCVEKLKEIQEFMKKIEVSYSNISLLLFVHSPISNFYNFEEIYAHEIDFQYPIIYDFENLFVTKNKLPPNQQYSMFLCNNENKVLVYGDFTKNESLKQLYLKEINKNAIPYMIDSPIIKQNIIKK
ncbi:MAG: hypothetical protein HQ543_08150 [Bacteroidetes bacterium]|nr:hypothetical protein [Bacteroidota bacterium]